LFKVYLSQAVESPIGRSVRDRLEK
jgi:hypothetical protein